MADKYDLSKFRLERILNNNSETKTICILGTFPSELAADTRYPAIVVLEKTAFTDYNVNTAINDDGDDDDENQCKSYFSHEQGLSRDIYSVKLNIISPCTETHIQKYSSQEIFIMLETPYLYKTVTESRLQLESELFTLDWVYNILEHKNEADRIIVEDPCKTLGFILLPDFKWDGTLETFYAIAIVHQLNLKSLRSLAAEHLPLLRNIQTKSVTSIKTKYGLDSSQLRIYVHYQPSFYHLHVHFTYLKYEAPGIHCERSHMLSTVINNIELVSDYYQRATTNRLSFFILEYVAAKIYGRKRSRQITSESSFKDFKLAVIGDDFVQNAVKSLHSGETSRNIVEKLSRAANISEFIAVSETHRMLIQRFLYEWNYVPAQDSPKHILNALNDDCIQEILRKLTDPSDFLSAAETCRDFQENALQCYPRNFKELSLSLENKSVGRYTAFPLKHASNFLKIFGHLILYMELISDFEDGTIDMIAKNCGETLIYMYIEGHENTKSNFNDLSHFKTLIDINISSISMDNVELPENLECINLTGVKVQADLQCIMKKFPKLKYAYFDKVDNLNDAAFNAFIMLNPQIEMLLIVDIQNLSFSAINSISDRLPNLVDLRIDCQFLATHEYNELVMHFKQFQQLRHLAIGVEIDLFIPAVTSIDSIVTNIPKIETLRLVGFLNFDQTLPGLLQLDELKLLDMYCFDYVPFNTILELVKASPTLKDIRFNCFTISVSEIMNILEYSKNLNTLEIWINKMDMVLSVYNSILALIKGRLEVVLRITDGNIDENIFKQNMQRLKIVRGG